MLAVVAVMAVAIGPNAMTGISAENTNKGVFFTRDRALEKAPEHIGEGFPNLSSVDLAS